MKKSRKEKKRKEIIPIATGSLALK